MHVEYDHKTQTYTLVEGNLVRSRLSAEMAKKLMNAPNETCEAILAVARRSSSAGEKP